MGIYLGQENQQNTERTKQLEIQKRIDIVNQLTTELVATNDHHQPLLDEYTRDSNSLLFFLRYMGFWSKGNRAGKIDAISEYAHSIRSIDPNQRENILNVVNEVVFNQYPKLDRQPRVKLDSHVIVAYFELRNLYTPEAHPLDWILPNLHCISWKSFEFIISSDYKNSSPIVPIRIGDQGNDPGGNIARIVAKALEEPTDSDHYNLLLSLYNVTKPGTLEREKLLAEVSIHIQQARDSNDLSTLTNYEELLEKLYTRASLKQTNPPRILNNELYDSLHKALRREYVHAICHPKADLTGMLALILSSELDKFYKGYTERIRNNRRAMPTGLVSINDLKKDTFQAELALQLSTVGSLKHLDELIWNHDFEKLAIAILTFILCRIEPNLRSDIYSQKEVIRRNPLLSTIFGLLNNT